LKQVIQAKEKPIKINSGFAVLELFTSQGCSSCPPADAILGKFALENNPNIIPLAFHVDYWNRLGWKDPFSNAEFSNRQRDYAQQMNSQNIYTPQLIINGKYDVLGSDENTIKKKINQELTIDKKTSIVIKEAQIKDNLLNVEFDLDKVSSTSVVNIALVKKKEFTAIKRGENSGLKQTNYNIVFDFKSISKPIKSNNKVDFDFQNNWVLSDFKIVVYAQSFPNGEITNVAQKELTNY
jgi:hypothetical protein